MRTKIYNLFLSLFFFASCNFKTQNQSQTIDTTTHTIKLTDSSRVKLENALDDMIQANINLGDTTISGRFVNQRKDNNGDFYITIKASDSTMTLINLSQLRDDDIAKLKKNGNNITVTYNQSDKTIKFLATQNEQQK